MGDSVSYTHLIGRKRAEAALVHLARLRIARAHLIGAGSHAVQTTDAPAVIHFDDAVGAHVRGSGGAHARARRVLAVHALQRDVFHGHVGVLAHFTLFKADERLIGKQVVLALASRAAGIAADRCV